MKDKDFSGTYKKVTTITLSPGYAAAIAANEEKRKKALELVNAEIEKEVEALANQIWGEIYGSIQI